MSKVQFHKYHGTGNDFIMIDNRKAEFPADNLELIRHLCHRRFGIGADGLILIEQKEGYDFAMNYFNADGTQSMCGNGGRCAVMFAHRLGIFKGNTRFWAIDGAHEASMEEQLVRLRMQDVLPAQQQIEKDFYWIDTGSPHYIVFKDEDWEQLDAVLAGRAIRNSPEYVENGVNVNFLHPFKQGKLFVRTYERGVEDETLSCGTGVTASAIAYFLRFGEIPEEIQTLGGTLKVEFEKNDSRFTNVYLIGPAEKVFEGEIKL